MTLLGMVTSVKPLQPEKVDWAMLVKLLGISMEVKPVQPEYLQLVVYQKILIKTVEK